MLNYKLSIIIPAYNATHYIEETLTSILSQKTQYTYELIIVNDGSTDDTASTVTNCTKIFPNVQLLNIKNSGPAIARNIGIASATGEYIAFVDSDDKLLPGAIEDLLSLAIAHDSDLLIYGFEINNVQTQERFFYRDNSSVLNGKANIGTQFASLYEKNLLNQIWNKLYKRTLLVDNHITFPDYKYGEDRLFVFKVLKAVDNITVTNQCYYEYYMRDNESLVNKYCENKFEICCEIDSQLRTLANTFGCLTPQYSTIYDYMYIKSVISCFTILHNKSCPLTKQEKKRRIYSHLTHTQVRSALEKPFNGGISFRIMKRIMKTKNVTLTYFSTYMIVKISKVAPKVFIKAKHFHNKNN